MADIYINGESKTIEGPTSLAALLALLGLSAGHLAVAVNSAVVPRSAHAETTVKDGDKIEIVQIVGGG